MPDEPIIPVSKTDAILWYNVGQFGEAGYAVPNFSGKVSTLNTQIASLVSLVGKQLFAIMHHEDARMRTPPSINTVMRFHKLYVRAGQILNARAVGPGEMQFEVTHLSPQGEIFRVFPTPFFLVRNPFMKYCAQLTLMLIAEMMQHTENTKAVEITTVFSGKCGAYLKRIYTYLATELYGIPRADAMADGFLLTDVQLRSYDPQKWFTGTELVDQVPSQMYIFTEDQLTNLSEGIPATSLPTLRPWPVSSVDWAVKSNNQLNAQELAAMYSNAPGNTAATGTATETTPAAGPVFPAPVN